MSITAIRAFKDNYIWLLPEKNHPSAWVVDPGDAFPVLEYFAQQGLNLAGILLTHHHADHSGGIRDLVCKWPNVPVYGSHQSQIDLVTVRVKEGDQLMCGQHRLHVLEIPGHTLDHVAFYNDELLFCGDTLFSAGCGRVFEGTYPQMYASLSKLASLSDKIQIYCGHEYTLQNLLFAAQVEPANEFIQKKIVWVKEKLKEGQPSLPSTLADEKQMNPFLRCEEENVVLAAQRYANFSGRDACDIFKILREWKNIF